METTATPTPIQYYLGEQAIENLIQYCQAHYYHQFYLIADHNTYAALGQQVDTALRSQNWDVRTLVFSEAAVVPDEKFIVKVLNQADQVERVYIVVGSGTLTDITRFVSHRTHRPFISLPTAASVDGYTSPSSSLVLENLKVTVISQPPIAIFVDLPTLIAAPHRLTASGFGDMLGKYIALADWQLGYLLWEEPYDAGIAARVRRTLTSCMQAALEIGRSTPEGIRILIDGLIESGMCMLEFGNSRPAAAAEHYLSHYLELKLLQEGRPAVLHGAKVGMSSILVAGLYAQLRRLDRAAAIQLLEASPFPERDQEEQKIKNAFPAIADHLLHEQRYFLDLAYHGWDDLKQRILYHWEAIQNIAAQVPTPAHMASLLRQAGGATEPGELGLNDGEVQLALNHAHYLRNRFTISKLNWILHW